MYDELVKRVRQVAEEVCYDYDVDPYIAEQRFFVIEEAADAIEELSEYVSTIRRLKCEGWYLQRTKFHDGYHAVSNMPLPEPPGATDINRKGNEHEL